MDTRQLSALLLARRLSPLRRKGELRRRVLRIRLERPGGALARIRRPAVRRRGLLGLRIRTRLHAEMFFPADGRFIICPMASRHTKTDLSLAASNLWKK